MSPSPQLRQRTAETTRAVSANVPEDVVRRHREYRQEKPWYMTRVPLGFLMQGVSGLLLSHDRLKYLMTLVIPYIWFEVGELLGRTKRRSLNFVIQAVGDASFVADFLIVLLVEEYFPEHDLFLVLAYCWSRAVLICSYLYLCSTPYKDMISYVHVLTCSTCVVFLFRTSSVECFVSVIVMVSGSDAFQYFAGKVFGRTKIVPSISPNKTLEGYVGGMLVGGLLSYYFSKEGAFDLRYACFYFGLLVSASLGDLAISTWKRFHQLKDTSTLLQAHGGVLDRLDSLLGAWLYLVLYLYLMGVDPHSDYTQIDLGKFLWCVAVVWALIWTHWLLNRIYRFMRVTLS